MSLDALMERVGDRLSDDIVPTLISELTEEERAAIRAAAVAHVIAGIKAGANGTNRRLVEQAESEIWQALRKHPAVLDAIKEAAESLSGATVAAIQKAVPKLTATMEAKLRDLLMRAW